MTDTGMARKASPSYSGHYLKGNYKRLTIWQLIQGLDCSMNAPFVLEALWNCAWEEKSGLVNIMD